MLFPGSFSWLNSYKISSRKLTDNSSKFSAWFAADSNRFRVQQVSNCDRYKWANQPESLCLTYKMGMIRLTLPGWCKELNERVSAKQPSHAQEKTGFQQGWFLSFHFVPHQVPQSFPQLKNTFFAMYLNFLKTVQCVLQIKYLREVFMYLWLFLTLTLRKFFSFLSLLLRCYKRQFQEVRGNYLKRL